MEVWLLFVKYTHTHTHISIHLYTYPHFEISHFNDFFLSVLVLPDISSQNLDFASALQTFVVFHLESFNFQGILMFHSLVLGRLGPVPLTLQT